tara:strand:+ start:592 stop:1680 length:1089 start_codon:yes stop_codon:yes gene_type:complete
MNIVYIAETSLTNKSAYTVHVLKMCDALSKKNNLTLLLPKNEVGYKTLKKEFLFTSKNKFKIKSITNFKIKNFFLRLYFSYKTSKQLRNNQQDLILTRSFLTSFFMSIWKINHILEIHSEFRGLTKILMINLNFINSIYIKRIIFISNALRKKFYFVKKRKTVILHDAVDIKNFLQFKHKNNKKIENLTYVGSFHEGKGVEMICKLAPRFKKLKFNVFGHPINKNYPKISNLKFHGYIKYKEVPKKLASSDILLLPSSKIQYGRSKSVNISNYNSPLKMFDYLAAGKIIISSKLKGICEVLKHNYNSIITNGFEVYDWENSINLILNNKYDLNYIRANSLKTARKYTWEKRAQKIISLKNSY